MRQSSLIAISALLMVAVVGAAAAGSTAPAAAAGSGGGGEHSGDSNGNADGRHCLPPLLTSVLVY